MNSGCHASVVDSGLAICSMSRSAADMVMGVEPLPTSSARPCTKQNPAAAYAPCALDASATISAATATTDMLFVEKVRLKRKRFELKRSCECMLMHERCAKTHEDMMCSS